MQGIFLYPTPKDKVFLTRSFEKPYVFSPRNWQKSNCNHYNPKIIHPNLPSILQSLDVTIWR